MSRSAWCGFLLSVALLGSSGAATAGGDDGANVLEVAGGVAIPLDEAWRQVFGNGAALSLAYAARPGSSDTWAFAEVGLSRTSGFTYDRDPTFDLDETHQWLLPLTFGVRTALSDSKQVRARLYAGLGLQVAAAWRDDPLLGTANGMAVGIVFHLRQDFALTQRYGLWLQPRLVLLSPVDYGQLDAVNHSGVSLDLGMSVGKAAGTLRH